MPDALERLRAANPLPSCPPPPIEDVWRRVELGDSSGDARSRSSRAGHRFRFSAGGTAAVFATATAVTVAVLAIALLGHRPTGFPASGAPSPPALIALHAQAGQLLGSAPGLPARIRALRGDPIVVDVWASWCNPCRGDLGRFASASARYGQHVAFLGADFDDTPRAARSFLAKHATGYPSYITTHEQLHSILSEGISGLPAAIFIDSAGEVVHVHTGEYGSLATLEHDITHYLPRRSASQAPSSAQRLIADLGVLRQPQTPAARAFNRTLTSRPPHATIDPKLTRLVRLSHGIRVWLYVVTGRGAGLGISERGGGGKQRHPQVGFGECCTSPGQLERASSPGPLASSSAPGADQVYVEVVPDGVARVRWTFPRRPNVGHTPHTSGLGPFARPLTATVIVHDNVAAAVLPDRWAAQTVVWYDASGHIIASHTGHLADPP